MKFTSNLAMTGVSLFSLTSPALAQDAATHAENSTSEEIVVMARRRGELAQDVPLVVNPVTSQELQKLNIRDFKDVQSLVPGLSLTPAADGLAPSATLRGVDYQVNNSGSNATVQFYLNDAPVAASFLFQTMYDVGQIEVLRGPQGTLRGIAAPSGSITVATHKPDLDEVGGYVSGNVNSIGGLNINGAVNVPIIKGILALRVAGIANDDEANRVHSINNPALAPFSRARGERVSLRFDPVDSLDIIGTYQHYVNRAQYFDQMESANLATGTSLVGSLVTPASRESVEDVSRNYRQEYNVYNLQAEWKFAGQKLNYVGGWSHQDYVGEDVGDKGNAFDNTYPGNAAADPVTAPNLQNYGGHTHSRSIQQSHEIRLSSDERLFGMVDYVIGGLINRQQAPTDLIIDTPIFAAAPSPATFVFISQTPISLDGRSLERSAFANVNVHLGDATEISGGVRYIHFNNYSTLTLTNGGFSDFKTTVYSGSIKHRFNENIMVYASTGSSWRIGAGSNGIILAGAGNTAFSDPALAALNGFTPEKSKSYEIGVKTDWLNRRLHANVTYYHQDFDNYIFSSAPILFQAYNGSTYTPSVPRAGLSVGVPVKVNGVEAEFGFQPSPNFSIGGTVSYSLGKIVNGLVPCNGSALPTPPQQINFCTVNQRSGLIAPFSATIQSEYSHAIAASYEGFVRGQLTYYGNSQTDPTNPYDDVKAYGLVNLFVGVHDAGGGWEISAYGKNVFNTQRVLTRDALPELTGYATFTGGGAIFTNYRGISMTAPREFGLNLRVAFGSR